MPLERGETRARWGPRGEGSAESNAAAAASTASTGRAANAAYAPGFGTDESGSGGMGRMAIAGAKRRVGARVSAPASGDVHVA